MGEGDFGFGVGAGGEDRIGIGKGAGEWFLAVDMAAGLCCGFEHRHPFRDRARANHRDCGFFGCQHGVVILVQSGYGEFGTGCTQAFRVGVGDGDDFGIFQALEGGIESVSIVTFAG